MNWTLEVRDSVAHVSYANPPENRLPFSALRDLDSLLETIHEDAAVKLVLFLSGVDGVFSAGADLGDVKAISAGERPSAAFDWWLRALMRVEELPQPTIAFVDGLAASGGAELALACTMRVATARAQFVFREIARGADSRSRRHPAPPKIGRNRACSGNYLDCAAGRPGRGAPPRSSASRVNRRRDVGTTP